MLQHDANTGLPNGGCRELHFRGGEACHISLKSRHLLDRPKHMPLTERNFRRKRKQLPELQASQEHERPYTSPLLKDAKCTDGSLSRGRLFPCRSSFTLDLNPPPCSWHPRSQVHPSECITVVTDDPRARLIWDMGLLCGHRTDIPWRQPQWAGGVAALPPTERGQCRLKPSSQQKPLAGFPGWLAGGQTLC